MKKRKIILKIISELKTTISEIKKDKANDFQNDGGYIICFGHFS